MKVTRDTGPCALVWKWLLDADVSDRAIRLYAVLGTYADHETDETNRGRRDLADALRCSTDSVDRAVAELVGIGALEIEETTRPDGSRGANLYRLLSTAPLRMGGRTGAEGGGRTGAETSTRRTTPDSETTTSVVVSHGSGRTWKVDRRSVTPAEEALARHVLDHWNAATGQRLASREWLAKIIMRIREHPDGTLDDHRRVIVAALADPWWRGPASPSVVYGNGAQFERAVEAARASQGSIDEIVADAIRGRP